MMEITVENRLKWILFLLQYDLEMIFYVSIFCVVTHPSPFLLSQCS